MNDWHLNKTVNLAVVLVLIINVVGGILAFRDMQNDITNHENRISNHDKSFTVVDGAISGLERRIDKHDVTLAEILVTLQNLNIILVRIDNRLESR